MHYLVILFTAYAICAQAGVMMIDSQVKRDYIPIMNKIGSAKSDPNMHKRHILLIRIHAVCSNLRWIFSAIAGVLLFIDFVR
jgi:hypothetical protein